MKKTAANLLNPYALLEKAKNKLVLNKNKLNMI